METTTVTEARTHLSRLLAQVQQGESVLILSRGRPVARLVPVREPVATATDLRVEHLVRRGILRRPALPLVPSPFDPEGAPAPRDRGLLAALLADRAGGCA